MDNMALLSQLDGLPGNATLPSNSRPRLREVSSPLSWVYCFLTYVAVRTPDIETRNLLTYACLIIREAQRHGGPGWLEYDRVFREQAAMDSSIPWQEINASLHAATVLSYRAGPSQFCRLCRESDHTAEHCALAYLQPPPSTPYHNPGTPMSAPTPRRVVRPETLERICSSWNMGRCVFPDSCRFKHICATCKRRGHKARECEETPADSPYKTARAKIPGREKSNSSVS